MIILYIFGVILLLSDILKNRKNAVL